MNKQFKEQLHSICLQKLKDNITSIEQSINDAQDSANQETKSTAGDKHDTSRAMMQLEVEQKSKQLAQAKKLYNNLQQINPSQNHSKIESGTMVVANNGIYYIAIGLGNVKVENQTVFCISPASPIAQKMLGLKKGEQFDFNGKIFQIKTVF